jgi:small-conductance mechanosensitive channel
MTMEVLMNALWNLMLLLAAVVPAVLVALLVHWIVFRACRRFSTKSPTLPDGVINKHCRRAGRWMLVTAAVFFVLRQVQEVGPVMRGIQHALSLLLIFTIAWLLNQLVWVFQDIVFEKFRVDISDNLRARKVRTQLTLIRRILTVIIVMLAAAAMLMTFEGIEQLGKGLLASAGIAGVVIGFAAQRTLGTFVAGMQIAFTQPIRVDDVVIVEGEWGRIEEITLTYVVVKIWDLRRLILPINYFIEKPFQNWTRVSADILGTVFLYVDYTVPLEAIRQELTRLLKDHKLWDGKVNVVQVTNATERTVEVRLLVSAKDAGSAWDLRCDLREKMIDFLQREYPDTLPRIRAELEQKTLPEPS